MTGIKVLHLRNFNATSPGSLTFPYWKVGL